MIRKFYDIELDYSSGGDINYKVAECMPFQRCPICNGSGQIPADGFTSSVYQQCPTCNGQRIIPMYQIIPKQQESNDE